MKLLAQAAPVRSDDSSLFLELLADTFDVPVEWLMPAMPSVTDEVMAAHKQWAEAAYRQAIESARASLDKLAEDATQAPPDADDDAVKPVTEDDMLRALWRHAFATGWYPIAQVTHGNRRIDMLWLRPAKKDGIGPYETLAIEVKVSKEDWRRDMQNPAKQQAWRDAATRHAYAVPTGLIYPDQVPAGSGLINVTFSGSQMWGKAEFVKNAPYINGHAPDLPTRTWLTLLIRLAEVEGRARGWHASPAQVGSAEELRVNLTAAQKAQERAQRAEEKAKKDLESWRTLYMLTCPQGAPCRWCGEPIKPLNPNGGWFKKFRHMDAAHDGPCEALEDAQREIAAQEAYEAADAKDRGYQQRLAMGRYRTDPVLLENEPWRAYLTDQRQGPYPADRHPEAAE